jgi:NAD(P)-dependent dehydrogenase (short-subunit alcohol dehydrogenase family)
MRELDGRSALLTGASSGLGPIIARHLHQQGVRFILSARRESELQRLADELDSRSSRLGPSCGSRAVRPGSRRPLSIGTAQSASAAGFLT